MTPVLTATLLAAFAIPGAVSHGSPEHPSSRVRAGDHELEPVFEDLCDRLRDGGTLTRAGRSDDLGAYLVVAVSMRSSDGDPLRSGRQRAIREMGAYLGVEISASSEIKKSSRVTGVGEEREVEFFRSFESRTTTSIQQTLAGASLFTSNETESALRLGFALTERETEAVRKMASGFGRAPDEDGVTRVEAVGIGAIKDGNVAAGRQAAVSDALRNAIRKSAGTMLIAQDAKVGREFLEEQVFSATSGFCSGYELIGEKERGAYFEVRVLAEVDGEKVIEDFGQHLQILGEPTFSFDEVMLGGAAPGGRLSPLGEIFHNDLGTLGFQFMDGRASDVDYALELRSTWTPITDPYDRQRTGVQLQADLSWTGVDGGRKSLLGSNGRVASWLGGRLATRQCAEKLAKKELSVAREAIQSRLSDFMANGRAVTVELEGLDAGLGAELAGALRKHPLVLDASARYDERVGSTLALRTFVRSSDLLGVVRVAASEAISVATDLRPTRVQTTALGFRVGGQ